MSFVIPKKIIPDEEKMEYILAANNISVFCKEEIQTKTNNKHKMSFKSLPIFSLNYFYYYLTLYDLSS